MSDSKYSQLGNKYILLDLIGVGGMAEVYRCKLQGRQGFEKIIVLKKLLDQAAQDRETVANFIDEAKLAALLQHENIAHIYDFGEIEGSYFIAMEYLFGKDLHAVVQRNKEFGQVLDEATAMLIASKICAGMHYAHTLKDLQQKPLNIIHRDLSPHNVFITYDGKVKIIDFGVAQAELFDHRTRSGVVKGKISYMSPEQLTDEKIDLRSDIFSIGILLYEMVSGRKMYVGDTAELIRKCMQVEYEPIEHVRPDLDERVCRIINTALQHDRMQRYSSCAQMRDDIENCLYELGKRSHVDTLKKYMNVLFATEYESEKSKLYSTARRFDTIYNADNEEQTRVTSYRDDSLNETVFVDATTTLTVVMDKNSDKPHSRIAAWGYLLLWSTPYRRAFSILALVVLLIVSVQVGVKKHQGIASEDNILTVKSSDAPSAAGPTVVGAGATDTKASEDTKKLQDKERQRADAARDAKIEALIMRGDTSLKEGKGSPLELELAAEQYQLVLDMTPGDIRANNGLQRIAEKYAELAEKELQNNNLIDAERRVENGLVYSPQNGRLLAIYNLVEQEKSRVIEQLSWKAQRAMDRNELTTPVDDCAFKYYRQILKIDRKNVAARKGMRTIGDKYAVMAEKSYRSLNMEKAREYVQKGLRVVPEHRHLLELQSDLSRSKPGIFLRVLKKNYDVLIE